MESYPILNSYIPFFEDKILRCRKIYNHLVIFDREGIIAGARTNDPRLSEDANFYSFMKASEASRITELCNSFDLRWITVDTELGCAAVYTALYGICKLLFAVIFIFPKELVRDYFTSLSTRAVYISPDVEALPIKRDRGFQTALITETFQKANSAFSCQSIEEARYRLGAGIGKFLAERILTIADFVGCIGSCKTALEFIPRLDSFSPEIFTAISSCATLFARNNCHSRSFEAKIDQYKEHLLISVCVEVDGDFELYANRELGDRLLSKCESITFDRDAFFDCSLLDGDRRRLILSCVPETDPLVGRRIKQDIKAHICSFWEQ